MNNLQKPAATSHSQNSLVRYQLFLIVMLPVLLGYTIFLSFKYRSLRYLLQRLGIFTKPSEDADVWIHAASVGEVNAAIPLISAIRKKFPNKSILVTTVTPTGAELFRKKQIPDAYHLYLPIDYPRLVLSLVHHCKPKCALVMETEIWPNLFRICYQNHIPVCTINGRLSGKTLDTAGWIRSLYKAALQYSSIILTRSDNDAKNYVALGAESSKVKTIGNIKFSVDVSSPHQNRDKSNRPYIIAASTHDNEEYLIASLWKKIKLNQLSHNYLLMITPRHPDRLNEILASLKSLELNIAVRSRQDNITGDTDIYITDTVGELIDFMADAEAVFVGGSLVPTGGHNVIEPAMLGKPIIFGPYMENFQNEAELLTNFNAAIQIEDNHQLEETFEDVLQHPDKYKKMGLQARQIIEQHRNTAERYVEALAPYLN